MINKDQAKRLYMKTNEFDGSLVLEMLAAVNKLDEFYEAIDSDDFAFARNLMVSAGIDKETITWVVDKMHEADGEH